MTIARASSCSETAKSTSFLRMFQVTPDERAATGPGPVIAELQASGVISAEHIQAAERWRTDWLVFRADALTRPEVAAGKAAGDRLDKVRNHCGLVVEMHLFKLLVCHLSLETMAALFYHEMPIEAAIIKARVMSTEAFELLAAATRPHELLVA